VAGALNSAGIEDSLSQGIRLCGLRRSRYVGLAKTHMQHVATAAALNVARLDAWLHEGRGPPREPRAWSNSWQPDATGQRFRQRYPLLLRPLYLSITAVSALPC
jgi:Transposase DDE domain